MIERHKERREGGGMEGDGRQNRQREGLGHGSREGTEAWPVPVSGFLEHPSARLPSPQHRL